MNVFKISIMGIKKNVDVIVWYLILNCITNENSIGS